MLGGFSNEADKVQRSQSAFKSKFFRLSKHSQSRKQAVSKCDEIKFDKIDESNNKSHSDEESSPGVANKDGEEVRSSNAEDNNDLGVPTRKRRWDRKSRAEGQRDQGRPEQQPMMIERVEEQKEELEEEKKLDDAIYSEDVVTP